MFGRFKSVPDFFGVLGEESTSGGQRSVSQEVTTESIIHFWSSSRSSVSTSLSWRCPRTAFTVFGRLAACETTSGLPTPSGLLGRAERGASRPRHAGASLPPRPRAWSRHSAGAVNESPPADGLTVNRPNAVVEPFAIGLADDDDVQTQPDASHGATQSLKLQARTGQLLVRQDSHVQVAVSMSLPTNRRAEPEYPGRRAAAICRCTTC
jgi:hypothetical protein